MSPRSSAFTELFQPRPLGLAAVSLAVLTLSMSHILPAQTSKGTLVGVVRDSSGAVIPNAKVSVIGRADAATREVQTKGDGSYRFDALDPEAYDLSVSEAGFSGFKAQNVVVPSSQVVSYDVKMSPGETTTTVEVQANSALLNTENGQLTGVIDSTELSRLPIFSLNPYELAYTAPGAQLVRNGGFSNGQNVQVNGARPRANNFLLDSQEINDVGIGGQAFQPAIPDSYQELAVLTSAASAEFGRAGGAVINLTTLAGTNVFHGTAYERYEGSGLASIGGQERGTGAVKARFNTHTYGFTLGGPAWRDKLFGFGGLELKRYYGRRTPLVLELPDAAGYATLQALTGTAATQVALLNQYVSSGSYLTSYVNVQGRTTVRTNVGPQPGCASNPCIITENYFQRPAVSGSNPDTQWTYRIDFKPRERDSFYARYIHDRGSSSPDFLNNAGALAGFDTLQGGPSELGAGGWTHLFTSNFLNEFRISETRVSFAFAPTPETQANPLFALNTINIGGLPSLGPNQNFPQGRGEDLYQLQDTVGLTKGRQSLRVGFDVGRQLEKDLVAQNAKGTLGFAGGGTYVTALGNFLQNQLGTSGTATRTFGPTRVDPHNWRSGVFAQDDIKLTSDLAINLGVRYDYLTNPENSLLFPGIDVSNPTALLNAPTTAGGAVTATRYAINTDRNNISPRFGFAYTPQGGGLFASGKTVLRGGFGIYYDSFFSNFVVNATQSAPNAPTGTLTSTASGGLKNATALISQITPALSLKSSVTSVDKNLVNPVTYQYNLGVEQQLPGNNLLAIRYVGARSNKLFANQQFNYFNGLTGQRLNPAYGQLNARVNGGSSNYNSLEIEGTHRFSKGFQIRANYVYSKNLDNVSEIFAPAGYPTSYAADLSVNGRRGDYGPSLYDHRHYALFAYVWSPGGLHSDNKFADGALGVLTRHWTISGISDFQSGSYSSFNLSTQDTNRDGNTANDRPILGNPSAPITTAGIDGALLSSGTPGVYYDIAANNATGALNPVSPSSVHWLVPYGPANQYLSREIGRNSFSNPGTLNTDLAVEKGIGLSYFHFERGTLNLRAELSNIANHNNVGVLDTDVLDIGNGNYLNRQNALEDTNRRLILWGKVRF